MTLQKSKDLLRDLAHDLDIINEQIGQFEVTKGLSRCR